MNKKPHNKPIKTGDSVTWATSQGLTKGKVIKRVTKSEKVANYTAHASQAAPQFKVKTVGSGKMAIHKPNSLKKV